MVQEPQDTTVYELSILMPCLNEELTIGTCIKKAQRFLQDNDIQGEIIIADNGSTDQSSQIAKSLGARVVSIKQKGYGSALLGGIVAAQGQYIIMGDADDSYDFSDLTPFLNKLREGYDLVIGNRFKGGIKKGAMPFLHQFLGNPVLSTIGKLFFRSPINDFHCGLRGLNRVSILSLDLQTTGMEFASEMVVKAALTKIKIIEVPTILYKDGRSRPPHLRTWSDGWRHLRFLLLYSPRWLFLYPGIILMVLGIISFAFLVFGPVKIGNIVLDVNTLLYSASMILVGFNSVVFAVFTKIFGISENLLPEDKAFARFYRWVNLERGLFFGFTIILIGLIMTIYGISFWGSQSFGPLEYSYALRLVIPAVLFLILGSQLVLSSFYLSILGLKRQ